jgi:hypothetical protein
MQSANLAFVIDQATGRALEEAIATFDGTDGDAFRAELAERVAAVAADPFKRAVRDSIEVGVVVPSILRTKLVDAGFSLVADDASLAEYGFASTLVLRRVLIRDASREIVAMGAAGNDGEALLHAVLGHFREHAAPGSDVPDGIATAPNPGGAG